MSATGPFVSAVVCTYNRCETLRRMLTSFYQQSDLDPARFELIVVDNNSSDATAAVVNRLSPCPGLRYVFEPRQGLSAARNRGISEARGEVVAFLDDDVLMSPQWLTSLRLCYAQTDAAAVGGRAHLRLEGVCPGWMGPLFRSLLSEVDFGSVRKEVPGGYGLWGLNLSFRRDLLLKVGGFDERLGRNGHQLLGGEESDALARVTAIGGRCYYEPTAWVEHLIGPERLEWEHFCRLAPAIGTARHLGDAPASVPWQTLRVLRSAAKLAIPSLHVRIHQLLGRDDYGARRLRWDLTLLSQYHRLRWQCLRAGLAESLGIRSARARTPRSG